MMDSGFLSTIDDRDGAITEIAKGLVEQRKILIASTTHAENSNCKKEMNKIDEFLLKIINLGEKKLERK